MSFGDLGAETLAALAARGSECAEVFLKRGRTRRFETGPQGELSLLSEERGWAVRAGGERSSFFAAGSGEPSPGGPWPSSDGQGLRLPEPGPPANWRPPADLDAPLVGEREAFALLRELARRVAEAVPGGRLVHGVLEDGSSESEVANSLGVRATVRRRLASLRLEVAAGRPPVGCRLLAAAREARRFDAAGLVERAVRQLEARTRGAPVERDRAELVIAPAVAARLLDGLGPLWVGPGAAARARRLRDRRGRLGSEVLSVVDDGRLPDGLLTAPVDGEGVRSREVLLVEEGAFRQPLVAWWQVAADRVRASGCTRRSSWRELPRPAPTHLYLRAAPAVTASSLLGSVERGYCLVDTLGAGHYDFDADRLAVPVCGYAVRGGRLAEPFTGSWLVGSPGGLLHGVRAVAGDLEFAPLDGLIGAPTLLVSGLELRAGGGELV